MPEAKSVISNKEILAEINLVSQIEQIETRLATEPNSIRFAQLADAYLGVGNFENAIATCLEGLRYYPHYATGKMILAKAYYLSGDKKKAQTLLKEFLQKHPTHIAAQKMLGDLALEEDDILGAVAKYRVAMRFDPINRALIQTLTELKDQFQKAKTDGGGGEDEDEKPVLESQRVSSDVAPTSIEKPVAKNVQATETSRHLPEEFEYSEETAKKLRAEDTVELPKEKIDLKIPDAMVEDLIVGEMTAKAEKDAKEFSVKDTPAPVQEIIAKKPASPPIDLTASAAFVDDKGILYFYDDDEVSFDEYKKRLDLKKNGLAQILDRAQIDRLAGGKAKLKPIVETKKAEPVEAKKPEPKIEVQKEKIVEKKIETIAEKKEAKKGIVKSDTDAFAHKTHDDDSLHRHVDSAFGDGEDTGVFLTPDQEREFFEKEESKDDNELMSRSMAAEEGISDEDPESSLDELEMDYKDYMDTLTSEEELEEAIFAEENESSADTEIDSITARLAKVSSDMDGFEVAHPDEDQDQPIAYSDYFEQLETEEEIQEASFDLEEEPMSFQEIGEWLDANDYNIDYKTYFLFHGDPFEAAKKTAEKMPEEPTMVYADYLSSVSDEDRAEAVLAEAQEILVTEKSIPVIAPVEKLEQKIPEKKIEVVPVEPIKTVQPVQTKQPAKVTEEVVEEEVEEEVEYVEEEINPQDATMELVESYALAGQYGMAYKVCKVLKMKNPTDAKVDRKVLELKRLYLWSSQLVG